MEEEQVYTIPLREVRKTQKPKKAAKAEKLVASFLKKHMKTEEVLISPELNQKIWSQGAENPPSKIRVRAARLPDGSVEAYPME